MSANPTGPLHVGHGRGAAFGASLANILTTAGFEVTKEYYVNDAGRQMDILAVSVWMRYLALAGEPIDFPANGYQGDYVKNIANDLFVVYPKQYITSWLNLKPSLPQDETEGGDKEIYIDALIKASKELLGEEGFKVFHKRALDSVLKDIKEDLFEFGVTYDNWFSEQTLFQQKAIEKGINALKTQGYTYSLEGALWFKSTEFGDEKDRVLIRANGQMTYFAADLAYHWNKLDRGFEKIN